MMLHKVAQSAKDVRSDIAAIRHSIRLVVVVLTTNVIAHTGWYTFEYLGHATGVNPAVIVGVMSGPIGVPIAVVMLVFVDRIETSVRAKDKEHAK